MVATSKYVRFPSPKERLTTAEIKIGEAMRALILGTENASFKDLFRAADLAEAIVSNLRDRASTYFTERVTAFLSSYQYRAAYDVAVDWSIQKGDSVRELLSEGEAIHNIQIEKLKVLAKKFGNHEMVQFNAADRSTLIQSIKAIIPFPDPQLMDKLQFFSLGSLNESVTGIFTRRHAVVHIIESFCESRDLFSSCARDSIFESRRSREVKNHNLTTKFLVEGTEGKDIKAIRSILKKQGMFLTPDRFFLAAYTLRVVATGRLALWGSVTGKNGMFSRCQRVTFGDDMTSGLGIRQFDVRDYIGGSGTKDREH